jgi:serine phosphatase RsbU (regulator of sigma subunit)
LRTIFLHIILFVCFLPSAFGQLTEDIVKTNFVINLAKFFEWEQEDTLQRYSLGVLGSNKTYDEFRKNTSYLSLKGKKLEVVQFKKISDINKVHLLYVESGSTQTVEKVLEVAIAEKILMFSDSCSNRNYTMINLLDLDMPGSQFEINKENLGKAHFSVPDKLLYYGGSEEDLRELVQASEQELSKTASELQQLTEASRKQREELEQKKQEVLALNKDINRQEKRLKGMIADAKAQQDSLDVKIALLQAQESMIQEQQANIEEQTIQLEAQKQELNEGTDFLNRQKAEIENQEEKIKTQQEAILEQTKTLKSQNREIKKQSRTIGKQQTLLYYFIAFFALLAGMVFFIFRAYRIKRQANKTLEEKNAAISRQKEEIQSQQEQLQEINQKIEKQNEDIKSSIHYALTIQQALLPTKEEMESLFDYFVLYRPRDIVSGDYYWMSKLAAEDGETEKMFVAVGDCTGHGVPGAFLSMIGIKMLNSIVSEQKQYDPAIILEMLNQSVRKALKQEEKGSDDGMDVCLCRIEKTDDQQFKLVYSGARRPLYYTREGIIETLPGDRKTIGGRFFKDQVFTNQELLLNAGDRIYLTSDGIADQNASNRRKFGSKRLIKLLEESLTLSMTEQKAIIEKTLDDFQGKAKQRDDISLMGIKL